MATLNLDILVINTYNKLTLGIADISTYPDSPPTTNPIIAITIPNGFGQVSLPFTQNNFNVFNSQSLGLSDPSLPLTPIPDGVYTLTYSVDPSYQNFVTKNFNRTDILQERFDEAFMKLDMMECDKAVKTQSKEDLDTIYYLIQGCIAAANECAIKESNTLYREAWRQLDYFINNNCGCTGNNYINNFKTTF